VLILVTYDVSTATPAGTRRLRRVAQACKDYGQRVQKSVFECRLGATQWVGLRSRLLEEIDVREDSLRVYFLEEDTRIENHGCNVPADLEGPLIV
jgi:CRISPR-associated protein Cas2